MERCLEADVAESSRLRKKVKKLREKNKELKDLLLQACDPDNRMVNVISCPDCPLLKDMDR